MFPLRHRECVIGRQQAAPHDEAQQASSHLRLDFGDGGGIEPGGGMEDDPARRGRVEVWRVTWMTYQAAAVAVSAAPVELTIAFSCAARQ